ncbi:MAG: DNA/RNA nuclease SfsA [Fimbriimonadaceae bacterium]|nr:DNA/RNA nuclease SfsA [Fimbriimonadaceae bacterium]
MPDHGEGAASAAPLAVAVDGPVLDARLVDRPNRYLAHVELVDGRCVAAHVPNPGRMREFMTPGRLVQVRAVSGPQRRTGFDLLACWYRGCWVCLDNRLGGRLAGVLLRAGAIDELGPVTRVAAEVTVGGSRLDYRLSGPAGPTWVEVKSCTLVEDGRGRFPDAPTSRGARHLRELTALAAAGHRAAVLFMIQRPDARCIGPHRERDPEFAAAFDAARAAGVSLLARTARWQDGMLAAWGAATVDDGWDG